MRFRLAFFVLASFCSYALGQDLDRIRSYIVNNNVGFFEATFSLGLDIGDALDEMGLDSLLDISKLGFLFIDCVMPEVVLAGSAADIGLDSEELTDYLKLRLANDVSRLPICRSPDAAPDRKSLSLILTLWTVGEDFPVAYLAEADTFIIASPSVPDVFQRPFKTQILGYGNATSITSISRDRIDDVVRQLGIDFLKGTGGF